MPLNGDANAIKKYADEMQKIKKQVNRHPLLGNTCICYAATHMAMLSFSMQAGALDPIEVADAKMEYDLECSGYNVRQFLGTISGQGALGELGHTVMEDILQVVEEIEQETEAVLDGENEEGWELFQSRVGVCHAPGATIWPCDLHGNVGLPADWQWICQSLLCLSFLATLNTQCKQHQCSMDGAVPKAMTCTAFAGHWQEAWSRQL